MSAALAIPPRLRSADLSGELRAGSGRWPVRVVGVYPHTLLITFEPGARPMAEPTFDGFTLDGRAGTMELGRCMFVPHGVQPHRRKDDPPPEPGDGRLVFVDAVHDFSKLDRDGAIGDVQQKLAQLPLVWRRKDAIDPAFRHYTADVVYDLQAYRQMLDELDRNLLHEPMEVRARIRQGTVAVVYPEFARFFDEQLDRLAQVVGQLSRHDHERHGFYFRKHVWDLLLASPFLARTNLKPRGYAGDSAMMNMLYEHGYRGATLFAMCMHRHPVSTVAAQAVRNRRKLIGETVQAAKAARPRVRVMSVACGPAAELVDVLRLPDDADRFDVTLLDQDPEALDEAMGTAQLASQRLKRPVMVRTIRESVRTMLRSGNLAEAWGRFDLVYSMGLFDYLQHPVARVVLARLYDLLEPGGELIVGNFHVGNPTRIYMEYWMDWVLLYRTEDEMLALAEGLPGASCRVTFEQTGSQMFLHVRKVA